MATSRSKGGKHRDPVPSFTDVEALQKQLEALKMENKALRHRVRNESVVAPYSNEKTLTKQQKAGLVSEAAAFALEQVRPKVIAKLEKQLNGMLTVSECQAALESYRFRLDVDMGPYQIQSVPRVPGPSSRQ